MNILKKLNWYKNILFIIFLYKNDIFVKYYFIFNYNEQCKNLFLCYININKIDVFY